jgi:hypothetical protein
MAVMLGTLQRMNKAGQVDQYAPGPYESEINRIKALWKGAMEPIHPEQSEDFSFGKPYDDWYEEMYEKLHMTYRDEVFKREDWKEAQSLAEELLEKDSLQASSLPVILNAAWICRIRNPDRLGDIEKKARELYEQVVSTSTGNQKTAPGTQSASQNLFRR